MGFVYIAQTAAAICTYSDTSAANSPSCNRPRLHRESAPLHPQRIQTPDAVYSETCIQPFPPLKLSNLIRIPASPPATFTMPGRTLPTIPVADVQAHNTKKSCYVTIGTKVYDVTDFLDDHPGGGDLILEYGGKDIAAIMKDEISHTHSEAAYEILDESLVGFMATEPVMNGATKSNKPGEIMPLPPTKEGQAELAAQEPLYASTGMSNAEDLSKETDIQQDYKQHKFLDLSKPLFMQVWNGGFKKDFYLEQVHRPRHYRGGDSAPLFGNFLEPLSKTPWWVVPTIWVPPVIAGTVWGCSVVGALPGMGYWFLGLAVWTLLEYVLHRFLFHLDQ